MRWLIQFLAGTVIFTLGVIVGMVIERRTKWVVDRLTEEELDLGYYTGEPEERR